VSSEGEASQKRLNEFLKIEPEIKIKKPKSINHKRQYHSKMSATLIRHKYKALKTSLSQ
jgi:hypothetical protein